MINSMSQYLLIDPFISIFTTILSLFLFCILFNVFSRLKLISATHLYNVNPALEPVWVDRKYMESLHHPGHEEHPELNLCLNRTRMRVKWIWVWRNSIILVCFKLPLNGSYSQPCSLVVLISCSLGSRF